MALPILKRSVVRAPAVEPCFNVMSLFDVMTGTYVKGAHGEHILTGGLAPFNAWAGDGNTFKSTVMYALNLIAMKRYQSSVMEVYDTENNLQYSRIDNLARTSAKYETDPMEANERFSLVKGHQLPGEKWWDTWAEFSKAKFKDPQYKLVSPFISETDGKPIKIFAPSFGVVDSLSGWTPSTILEKFDENELGDKSNNTIHARENLVKQQLLMAIKDTAPVANCFISTVAHLGNKISLDGKPVSKDMLHLPQGKKFGGVPKKFEYYTNVTWYISKNIVLQSSDKEPLYPRDANDNLKGDADLVEISMVTVRNKLGPTGKMIKVICSQEGGLHVALSEFHYCKEFDYGISGSVRSYSFDLMPNETLMRTTVRGKLDADPKLRRVAEITAEMCIMNNFWHENLDWLKYGCTPKELYEDLKAKGYDWDVLLNTRGYWLFEEEAKLDPLPYLSTMDLLRMRAGEYEPYWLKK